MGGGVSLSGASAEACGLSEAARVPIVTTLMAKSAVPDSFELNLGLVGMHGSKFANMALNHSDLIIACGARFSDRVTGKLDKFAPDADVIHIDIDPAEIGKNRAVEIPIVGDVKGVLATMANAFAKEGAAKPDTSAWLSRIAEWRARYPVYDVRVGDVPGLVVPEVAMIELSRALNPDSSIVVTEVGQHQMWAAQFIEREVPRTFLTSGGLGTMGFGFPAAIGAAIGRPEASVVCVAGDGSFLMNIQEMATAAIHDAAVKVVIMDNRALGMVRQWQKLFYHERYSFTELEPVPDFVKLAEAFGWAGERVADPAELPGAYARMLAHDGPYLLDVLVPRDQSVFPMVAPGKALSEVIGAIDAADGGVRTGAGRDAVPAGTAAGPDAVPAGTAAGPDAMPAGTEAGPDAVPAGASAAQAAGGSTDRASRTAAGKGAGER